VLHFRVVATLINVWYVSDLVEHSPRFPVVSQLHRRQDRALPAAVLYINRLSLTSNSTAPAFFGVWESVGWLKLVLVALRCANLRLVAMAEFKGSSVQRVLCAKADQSQSPVSLHLVLERAHHESLE
jgi:hypothetical protein